MTRLTAHYDLEEFRCRKGMDSCPYCGGLVPPREKALALAQRLELLRADLDYPLWIISGLRCEARNEELIRYHLATKASRHLPQFADAVDVAIPGDANNMIVAAIRAAARGFSGVGYKVPFLSRDGKWVTGFLHLDLNPDSAPPERKIRVWAYK